MIPDGYTILQKGERIQEGDVRRAGDKLFPVSPISWGQKYDQQQFVPIFRKEEKKTGIETYSSGGIRQPARGIDIPDLDDPAILKENQ